MVNHPDGRQEIHMTNAVRRGDKDALDNADTQPPNQPADEIATPSRQSQLRRLGELLARNTNTGTTNTFKHQKAHKMDHHLRPLVTNPTEDTANQIYIINSETTKAIEAQPAPTTGAAPTPAYDPIHVTLSVYADWAVRQVAVEGKSPFHDLGPCAWPPASYSATDQDGNFIDHTSSTIRKAVMEESGAHALCAHIHKNPKDRDRRAQKHASRVKDWTDLWAEESTASLRPPCGASSEATQRTYIRCMTGTLNFNTERTRDEPQLLDVILFAGGPKLSTKCPFCLKKGLHPEDGTDSVEHIMITCPSTAEQRNQRRDAIAHKLRGLASTPELDDIADSALSHPDANAGSVSLQTRDLVRECQKRNKDFEYKTGSIQGILLAATSALVDERTKLITGIAPITNQEDTERTDSDSKGEGHPPTPPGHPRQDNTRNLADTHDVKAFYAKLHKLQLKKRTAAKNTHKRATKRATQRNPTTGENAPKVRPAPNAK
ncbi:hypothetical protein T492DRAFT_842841 [Pavlovales sp. CCMP2436]|nr:hypothetical protein T492DRAFT_842841 [Pavlovales sp. CCMP2436]